jgi:predicted nuclease of predicted toxin-antitoxin system
MLPPRSKFPHINKYHDLKHVVRDFHKEGVTDEKVVELAKEKDRILISKNSKHMIELCILNRIRLICVTEAMSDEEIDLAIMSKLRGITKKDRLIKLSRPPRKTQRHH